MIAAKLALPTIEFVGVHAPPAASQGFVRHNRMQHFVIEDVFQKPARHECLIKQRMNSNDAIFFLDRSKNEMIFRPMFPAASPFHLVVAKPAAKIAPVQLIKDFTEIEMLTFLAKV